MPDDNVSGVSKIKEVAFYDRRKEKLLIDFPERRISKRRNGESTTAQERRRLAYQVRCYDREDLRVPICLNIKGKDVAGVTREISLAGLSIVSDTDLDVGTTMALRFSFGENLCYMDLLGEVVFCVLSNTNGRFLVGIRFPVIRHWEQKLLKSIINDFKTKTTELEKSLLRIQVSENGTIGGVKFENFASIKKSPNPIRQSCIHASKIIGVGAYLPEREITNVNIDSMVDGKGFKKIGRVIESISGIESRHYAASGLYPSDLAVEASHRALKSAGVDPGDLDVIISCGVSRDIEEPATANIIQDKLGAKNSYVFDLANACNGFLSAVDVLDAFIASGRCEIGLVVAGEVMSQYVTWDPQSKKGLKLASMSYTFGDGGGAVVLQRAKVGEKEGIHARWFLSDGSFWKVAVIPLMDVNGTRVFTSNASEIEFLAYRYVPAGVKEVLKKLEWKLSDIDLVIPHQVGKHVVDLILTKTLGVPKEKIAWSFPKHGNIGAASMPVALYQALEAGRVRRGDKALFVGGSGGFGAAVMGLVV
jgi:3-oxoacyl-[acyl-carrier-protein] synthase-3